jgi:hypothetical protein
MLSLTGTIEAATTIGGGINKRTGEVIPVRSVLQVKGSDPRGLFALYTLTVPDLAPYRDKIGETISVPVRAWVAGGGTVNLAFEGSAS